MTQSSVDEISVSTRGGELKVQFEENGTVWLKGPALKVFSGEVAL
jgi:diaminopimelate epimerase